MMILMLRSIPTIMVLVIFSAMRWPLRLPTRKVMVVLVVVVVVVSDGAIIRAKKSKVHTTAITTTTGTLVMIHFPNAGSRMLLPAYPFDGNYLREYCTILSREKGNRFPSCKKGTMIIILDDNSNSNNIDETKRIHTFYPGRSEFTSLVIHMIEYWHWMMVVELEYLDTMVCNNNFLHKTTM